MQRFVTILSVYAIFIAGCSGGVDPPLNTPGTDTVVDQMSEDDLQPRGDAAPDLESPDLWEPPADLVAPDTEPACQPGDGCFGDPCGDGSDCLSGLCVPHLGDTACTIECVEDCPDGWSCQALNTGPDMVFACVSPYAHLCRPCTDQADCETGGVEDPCIDYGAEGSFCGADCSDDGLCPPGYSCVDAKTTAGVGLKQCVADSGVCACSDLSVSLGLSTPCEVSNDLGTCAGLRICTDEGLTACDAPMASEEICDGLDNDCDGTTDDVACDDGNDCTADTCDAQTACTHQPLTGTSCDDGDVCTLADHCDAGTCLGTGIDCGDDNPCTTDSCDPTGGCIYTFNTAECDDGDPCTVADLCKQGTCQGFDIDCECDGDLDCLALEDGDLCNGTLVCDTGTLPHECIVDIDTLIDCPEPEGPDAACLEAACHPMSGECSFAPVSEGEACEDGDLCTLGDLCLDGTCVPGAPISSCDDGNPCTADACLAGQGCVFTPDDQASCDDSNPCTVGDHCAGGECTWTGGLDCDDDDLCTTDSCSPFTGCVYVLNQNPCDDGNLCTTGDFCHLGDCTGGPGLPCNDGNLCTDDSCNPATGCEFVPNAAACDDGDPCTTVDICSGGACVGSVADDCDDDNLCTDDSCVPNQGCQNVPNTLPCDDGSLCTTVDVCAGGACVGAAAPDCDDLNPCTDDSCDPVTGCVHGYNAAPCDDDDECTTVDICAEGACIGAIPMICEDGDDCTEDTCEPATGCVYTPITPCCGNGITETPEQCDDGNDVDGDGCSNTCVAPWVAFSQYEHSGRMVYIFKSNSSAALSSYDTFCEDKGLAWFTPKNQSDAQNLITYCYNLDSWHTWIITKNTTTSGTFGGYSVTVDSPGGSGYSNTGFSGIRKWGSSYCEPEEYGVTKCWDSDHSYDWLVCEGS